MKVYEVAMFGAGRLIQVRLKARGESDATKRAERLCPDAVHLSTMAVPRSGVRA